MGEGFSYSTQFRIEPGFILCIKTDCRRLQKGQAALPCSVQVVRGYTVDRMCSGMSHLTSEFQTRVVS